MMHRFIHKSQLTEGFRRSYMHVWTQHQGSIDSFESTFVSSGARDRAGSRDGCSWPLSSPACWSSGAPNWWAPGSGQSVATKRAAQPPCLCAHFPFPFPVTSPLSLYRRAHRVHAPCTLPLTDYVHRTEVHVDPSVDQSRLEEYSFWVTMVPVEGSSLQTRRLQNSLLTTIISVFSKALQDILSLVFNVQFDRFLRALDVQTIQRYMLLIVKLHVFLGFNQPLQMHHRHHFQSVEFYFNQYVHCKAQDLSSPRFWRHKNSWRVARCMILNLLGIPATLEANWLLPGLGKLGFFCTLDAVARYKDSRVPNGIPIVQPKPWQPKPFYMLVQCNTGCILKQENH